MRLVDCVQTDENEVFLMPRKNFDEYTNPHGIMPVDLVDLLYDIYCSRSQEQTMDVLLEHLHKNKNLFYRIYPTTGNTGIISFTIYHNGIRVLFSTIGFDDISVYANGGYIDINEKRIAKLLNEGMSDIGYQKFKLCDSHPISKEYVSMDNTRENRIQVTNEQDLLDLWYELGGDKNGFVYGAYTVIHYKNDVYMAKERMVNENSYSTFDDVEKSFQFRYLKLDFTDSETRQMVLSEGSPIKNIIKVVYGAY